MLLFSTINSAFGRNGDVMVEVWKDKTGVNDTYDP